MFAFDETENFNASELIKLNAIKVKLKAARLVGISI